MNQPEIPLDPRYAAAETAMRAFRRIRAAEGSTDMEEGLYTSLVDTLARARFAEGLVNEAMTAGRARVVALMGEAATIMMEGFAERDRVYAEHLAEARGKRDTAVRTAQQTLQAALAENDPVALREILQKGLHAINALDCTLTRRHFDALGNPL